MSATQTKTSATGPSLGCHVSLTSEAMARTSATRIRMVKALICMGGRGCSDFATRGQAVTGGSGGGVLSFSARREVERASPSETN